MRVLSLDRDADISPERPEYSPAGWYGSSKGAGLRCIPRGASTPARIGEVLKLRSPDLPPIIQVCDALSRNVPKLVETLVANCNAHGRRNL